MPIGSQIMTPAEAHQERINRILLTEGSLQDLKPFFPSRKAIFVHYAQCMAQMFPTDTILAECEGCHRRSSEFRVALLWRGIYHTAGTVVGTVIGILAVMGGHGILPHRRIDFTTTHGLCGDCFKQIRRRKMLGELAEKLCFVFILLGAIFFPIVLVMTPVLLFSGITAREFTVIVAGLGGGLICLAGGLLVRCG